MISFKTPFKIKILYLIILFFVSAIFFVPQIQQQFVSDKLPATGDLIHKRLAFFTTNYPNYYSPGLLQDASHSKFFHYLVSYNNILTGLTGDKTFYGFGLLNLLMFPLALCVLLIFARRLRERSAILAPLLFATSPLLVFPFFGQADQHLSYIFFTLFLYIVLFFKPQLSTKCAATLLLCVTFNSSFIIWLPLILVLIILQWRYNDYSPLFLSLLALLITVGFIQYPLGYLLGTSWKVIPVIFMIATVLFLPINFLLNRFYTLRHFFVITFIFLIFSYFITQQQSSPLFLSFVDIESARISFQSSSPIEYIFSVNPNKNATVHAIFISLVSILAPLSLLQWFQQRKTLNNRSTQSTLWLVIMIILAPSILRFLLLHLNFDYFIRTPLASLHTGRVNSLALFLLPVIIMTSLTFHKLFKKITTAVLLVALVVGILSTSHFYFNRVYTGWSQKYYQDLITNSLIYGLEENLSVSESQYSCAFYQQCPIKGTSDIQF